MTIGLPSHGDVGTQIVEHVTVGGPGLVAVGQDLTLGERDAAVWTSDNAVDWVRWFPMRRVFNIPGEQALNAVATSPNSLVAIGRDNRGGDFDAAVWLSDDGTTWQRTGRALGNDSGDQEMNGVIAAGPGWIAVGRSRRRGDSDAVVWLSQDGLRWERVGVPSLFGGPGDQVIHEVSRSGSRIVAVGSANRDAAVWTSTDGLIWERADEPQFAEAGDQILLSVHRVQDGFIAVGTDRGLLGDDAAAWLSLDGLHWRRLSAADSVFGGPGLQTMSSAVTFEGSYVVVGSEGSRAAQDAAVWLSDDGGRWQRGRGGRDMFGGAGRQGMSAIVTFRGLIIAAGWDGSTGEIDASFWIGRTQGGSCAPREHLGSRR